MDLFVYKMFSSVARRMAVLLVSKLNCSSVVCKVSVHRRGQV